MLTAALTCLALNVYHEARGDSLTSQVAVAHVVMNRVAHSRWPDDVCSVVKQGYVKGRSDCQFSWYCDGKSDKPYELEAWAKAILIARDVISGDSIDSTKGATHYHARYVNPWWSDYLEETGRIGMHVFYK